jgi:hypothetical protein
MSACGRRYASRVPPWIAASRAARLQRGHDPTVTRCHALSRRRSEMVQRRLGEEPAPHDRSIHIVDTKGVSGASVYVLEGHTYCDDEDTRGRTPSRPRLGSSRRERRLNA